MGTIIDGKTIVEKENEVTAARVQNLIKNGHARPKLVVIQVGNDPASSTYVRNKKIACEKVGILCEDIHIDEEKDPALTELRIIGEIQKANRDDNINGILVQLPLPKGVDEETVLNYINSFKDVDGFGYLNAGKLFSKKDPEPFGFIPCTPAGIIHMLNSISVSYGINFTGKNAVVIGRSNIVGKPVFNSASKDEYECYNASLKNLRRGQTVLLPSRRCYCCGNRTRKYSYGQTFLRWK